MSESPDFGDEKSFGRRIRRVVFDPNAFDADSDGTVQDGTRFQRPAVNRPGTGQGYRSSRFTNYWGAAQRRPLDPDVEALLSGDDDDKPDMTSEERRRRMSEMGDGAELRLAKPIKVTVPNIDKRKWNDMITDVLTAFSDVSDMRMARDDRRRIFRLVSALRSVELSEDDDGLTLNAPGQIMKLISAELKKLAERSDIEIRHLQEVRDALKASRDANRDNKTAFVELEEKAIGRRFGSVGRRVRRFVRSARFDPRAIDADDDGTVQEGTQFERPAGPQNMADAVPSIRARSIRTVFAKGGFSATEVKEIDPAIVERHIAEIVDSVESKFGKVNTVGDAIDALNKAHPNVLKLPEYLRNDRSQMLEVQDRANIYGYLHVLDTYPQLKKHPIRIVPSPDEPQTGIKSQFSDDGRQQTHPQAAIEFSYANNIVFDPVAVSAMAADGIGLMDTVAAQAGVAIIRDPRNRNLSDKELLDKATFAESMLTTIHEGGHAANFAQAYDDVFGGLTDREIADKVRSRVDSQILIRNKAHRGATTFIEVEDLITQVRFLENQITQMRQQTANLSPEDEKIFVSLVTSNAFDSVRAIEGYRDRLNDRIDNVIAAFSSLGPKGDELRRQLQRGNNPYSLVEEFQDEFARAQDIIDDGVLRMTGVTAPGTPFLADVEAKDRRMLNSIGFGLAFNIMIADALRDDLTNREVSLVRNFAKDVSVYAGQKRFSYYNNANPFVPVELIAELRTALGYGKMPTNPAERQALEKLVTWLFGKAVWEGLS